MDAVVAPPVPSNEPVRMYAPGSADRELPAVIDGALAMGQGEAFDVVAPHEYRRVLGTSAYCSASQAQTAIDAALGASHEWARMDHPDRAAIFLRAAELIAGPWRMRLNAATMLGQGKSC